jgi:hypothetical protein
MLQQTQERATKDETPELNAQLREAYVEARHLKREVNCLMSFEFVAALQY